MALPATLNTKENNKFKDIGGEVAVRVSLTDGFSVPEYDTITVTYPNATTEVFTYTLAAASQGVITVTYTDSSKENISTVVRS